MRPFKFILFGLGCLFFAIFAKSLLEKHVPKEKVHVLERPMLIGTKEGLNNSFVMRHAA